MSIHRPLAFAGLLLVAQGSDPTTLRPTQVTVVITNDTHYSGTYSARGISRICGKLDMMMPHRAKSFNVEFPDDEPDLAVRSVQFDADALPSGGTTRSFYLSVAVRVGERGAPPAWVVRAKEPQFNEPGVAKRTTSAGKDILVVEGIATTGTRVNVKMTLTCSPKKK